MQKPEFKFRHLGINVNGSSAAQGIVETFGEVFGQEIIPLPKSTLVGREIEIMHGGGPGANGHICFTVSSIPEALEYLSGRGWQADFKTAQYAEDGRIKIVYLEKALSGFAIHLFEERGVFVKGEK